MSRPTSLPRANHSAVPQDAGAVGLAHDLTELPAAALLAQQRAITEAARQCPSLWPLAGLRWTLLVAELTVRKRRIDVAS